MLSILFLTLGLYFVQMLLPPAFDYVWQGQFYRALGSRDKPPPATVHGNRARRALSNMTENLLLFLPLAVLIIAMDKSGALAISGGLTFFFSRAAYLWLYLKGIPTMRSIAWPTALFGLLLMSAAILLSL